VLEGEGGDATLNGLYLTRGRQHADHHLRVEHVAPHCDSRENFKGVLDDRSHGVFTGRIIVHKDAQKTDGKQSNMNLLLSDDARSTPSRSSRSTPTTSSARTARRSARSTTTRCSTCARAASPSAPPAACWSTPSPARAWPSAHRQRCAALHASWPTGCPRATRSGR
jgi:hypothetical protein